MIKAWHSITLWKRVLIGLAVGLLAGAIIRYGIGVEPAVAAHIGETYIYPVGQAFVRLIKMLIVPLIATTLVAGVTAMGDPKKLGTLGARTMAL